MKEIEQIDWSKVLLADDLRDSGSVLQRCMQILVGACGFLFRKSIPVVSLEVGGLLCVKSMTRDDYDKQWALTLGCIKAKKNIVSIEWSRACTLDPIRRLRFLPLAWCVTKFKRSFTKRLLGTLRSIYYLDAIYAFRNAEPARLLCFSEMRPVENVLVQYFNLRNIPTATLQHGLYIDYGAKPTVNRLNYEASCAQVFLAWGRETGLLIEKFNPNADVVICGAPQLKERGSEVEPACVYVVLDADINRRENALLLDAGRRLGQTMDIEFVACLHPRNNKTHYNFSGYTFLSPDDQYSRKGFVVGHTTTQLLKLARMGKRVFKLRSREPANQMISDAVTFADYDELKLKLQASNYPYDWALSHIAYIGDKAKRRYSVFFEAWLAGNHKLKSSEPDR